MGKYSMTVTAPETKKGDFVVYVKPDSQAITLEGAKILSPIENF